MMFRNLFSNLKVLFDYVVTLFLILVGFSTVYDLPNLESISLLLAGFKAALMFQSKNDKDLLREIRKIVEGEKTRNIITDVFGIESK